MKYLLLLILLGACSIKISDKDSNKFKEITQEMNKKTTELSCSTLLIYAINNGLMFTTEQESVERRRDIRNFVTTCSELFHKENQ